MIRPELANFRIRAVVLWRALVAWIRRRFARPDPVLWRLNRLRRIYRRDPAAGLYHRAVRDLLRGQVAPEYHSHYDRLLRMEQVTLELLRHQPPTSSAALVSSLSALTEQGVRLLEQLQQGNRLLALYPDGSTEQQMVVEARQRLIARIDETMALQESLPARLMQLSTASTGRNSDRLRETLADLNTRLEGMAESYDELRSSSFWLERSHSQSKERP